MSKQRIDDGCGKVQCLNPECNKEYGIQEDNCPFCGHPRIEKSRDDNNDVGGMSMYL